MCKLIGHANISITMDIYTHHIPERQNSIAAWLEKKCRPSKKAMTFSQIITHFFKRVVVRLLYKQQKTHEQNVRES
jgi:hypothetical protein